MAVKLNRGSGGGGKRDASTAAWSANIGAGGATCTAVLLFDDGVAGAVAVAAVIVVLPLLERGFLASVDEERLALRQPPPTGMLRRAPPMVQYRRQALQKWRGCDRL